MVSKFKFSGVMVNPITYQPFRRVILNGKETDVVFEIEASHMECSQITIVFLIWEKIKPLGGTVSDAKQMFDNRTKESYSWI